MGQKLGTKLFQVSVVLFIAGIAGSLTAAVTSNWGGCLLALLAALLGGIPAVIVFLIAEENEWKVEGKK